MHSPAVADPNTPRRLVRISLVTAIAALVLFAPQVALELHLSFPRERSLLLVLLPPIITTLAACASVLVPLFAHLPELKPRAELLQVRSVQAFIGAELGLGLIGFIFFWMLVGKFVDILVQLHGDFGSGILSVSGFGVLSWVVFSLLVSAGAIRLIWVAQQQIRRRSWNGVAISQAPWRLSVTHLLKIASVALAVVLPIFLLCATTVLIKAVAFWSTYIAHAEIAGLFPVEIAGLINPPVALAVLFSPPLRFAQVFAVPSVRHTNGEVPYRPSPAAVVLFVILAVGAVTALNVHNMLLTSQLETGAWRAAGPLAPSGELHPMIKIERPKNGPPRSRQILLTPDGRVLMTENTQRFGQRLWAVDPNTSAARLLAAGSYNLEPIELGGTTLKVKEDGNIWLETAPISFAPFPTTRSFHPRTIDTLTGQAK